MFKARKIRDYRKVKAGSINDLKEIVKYKLIGLVKDPKKHYNISLIGIGRNYNETKSLNGIYEIDLIANAFINKKEKYFAKVTNNRYVEIVAKANNLN